MTESRATTEGMVFGVVVAVAFALLISVIPDEWFEPRSWRLGAVFVAAAAGSPGFVALAAGIARLRHAGRGPVLAGSLAGAALFDGPAIGFVPSLYGHTGPPLAGAASTLLFGLAAVAVAGRMMPASSPN